ncbi:hypothetical protein ACFOOM_12185 [Streptomyces echinoruber]|uniref:DNA-binding protein n=1 Tax=Streptomyces echinoruber TaxID=68898 RepID=A0A918VJL8_9ACTN|nr:hypothetical protein [Streptomyces echinoruber]GHA01401.1 hypothetical protein GCM10010389_45950 [Streptomyces echinoruber]
MITARTGRDGRPLVTTTQAAYSLGMEPKQFRDWARRRCITPAGSRPNPSRGQALALWDLADIADAVRRQKTKQPVCQGT